MKQDNQAISSTQSDVKPTVKKFNLQEKLALCKQWYGSGLQKSEFAKQQGIRPEVFTQWTLRLAQKYLPKNTLRQPLSSKKTIDPNIWIPIAAKAHQEKPTHGDPLIETMVALPQGISFVLKLNTQQLQELIRGFSNGISTK